MTSYGFPFRPPASFARGPVAFTEFHRLRFVDEAPRFANDGVKKSG
jgi:hypothetical protein